MRVSWLAAICLGGLFGISAPAQTPVTTAFTYQGELRSGAAAASGLHDMRFRLYDDSATGSQVGPMLCQNNISVSNGKFTIALDFGAQFDGEQRYLEIDVRAD